MSIKEKNKKVLLLLLMLDEFLEVIIKDPKSATAAFSGIDGDMAKLICSDFHALSDKMDDISKDEYLNELGVTENEFLLNEFYDLMIRVLTVLVKAPTIIKPFCVSDNPFKKSYVILSSIVSHYLLGNDVSSGDKRKYTLYEIMKEIVHLESNFESVIENSNNNRHIAMIDTTVNAKFFSYKKIIDEKLTEVNSTLNEVNDAFEGEKQSISSDLVSYKKNADEIFNSYHVRLESIERTETKTNDLYQTTVNRVDNILKMASKEGMAAAFQKRHDDLKWPEIRWISLFSFSLISLTVFGAWFVETVFSTKGIDLAEVVSRISISIPLVWLAWFSAKQFNHVTRLREDYAYKVAVAMAYHGYKDEAGQIDSEMSGKLLENIILHFADNPVRLYKNDNSASMIEAVIKNNKLAEVVTAIRGGK